MTFVATFHTHLAAMRSARALEVAGVSVRLAPVPRRLSSSCGTCAMYTGEEPHFALLDKDTESVYCQEADGQYTRLREFD